MSFTNLDGDSFCVGTIYDPSKIAEFDSAHTKAEGVWYGAYDWRIKRPFVLANETEWKVISIDAWTFTLPTSGFYSYLLGDDLHLVVSGMHIFMLRSMRARVTSDELEVAKHGETISKQMDEFFGMIVHNAYYPGIPKVWPIRCLDSYHQFAENYPIPTTVQDGHYAVSRRTFFVNHTTYDALTRSIYFVGSPIDNLYEMQTSLEDFKNTYFSAIASAMSYGVELNEPMLARNILQYNQTTRYDNMNNVDRIRPRFFASAIGGIYTDQSIEVPIYYNWFLFPTLVGLAYTLATTTFDDAVVPHILFNSRVTHINNLLMSPATSSTLLAWATLKFLTMFFYPGYPYFNSVRYGDKDYELIVYINQPTEFLTSAYCVVPFIDSYDQQDECTGNPPVPNFSIFAENYMMFEGLLMGRSRPVNIEESHSDHYWYANESSVQITSIDVTVKKTHTNTADCSGIGCSYTPDPKKVNEFAHVDYSESTLNQTLHFAEGRWGRTITVAEDFVRPVLMSICSLNLLNKLSQIIIDRIKNKERSNTITASTYALIQVGETIHLPDNPFKSLNSRRAYVHFLRQLFYVYNTDYHSDSSKLHVYSTLANTEGLFSQTLLKETIVLKNASILFDNIKDNDTVLDVKGDIVHGFNISIMLESGANKTIHLDWKNDITLTTDVEEVLSRKYTGYGVFPHLVELENGKLLFHDDSSLIIYDPEKNSTESLPLPDLAGHVPSILPDETLLAIYKYVKGQEQQTP